MRHRASSRAVSRAAAILALAHSTSAHSWIEWASKVATNGTMVGDMGYARGWVPRNSTNPLYTDTIPQNILPVTGQSAYSGDEILNKYPLDPNPQYPMLEAAAGDQVALLHLENGHTTLPQNQPNKPRNRGTIYFYGTSQPKAQEKLFDVHLVWNKDGTGGDGRGVLLGTRNYDDGQCYQPNNSPLNLQRASALASDGAIATEELACQSVLKLPTDLKSGSTYTIYWYWDWPDLDAANINMDATKNGLFPWAGTFMRGQKDPHGFKMDAIAKNESYSSVVDIKITDSKADTFAAKGSAVSDFVAKQDVYSKAIKEQMENNFQVDIDGNGGGGDSASTGTVAPTGTMATTATAGGANDGVKTVTVTATVPATTLVTTVYKTVPAGPTASSQPPSPPSASTVMVTVTTHVPAGTQPTETPEQDSASTTAVAVGTRPKVTPFLRRKRSNWTFGED